MNLNHYVGPEADPSTLELLLEQIALRLESIEARMIAFGDRLQVIESTLERYRPLLDKAEQRMSKPSFFAKNQNATGGNNGSR